MMNYTTKDETTMTLPAVLPPALNHLSGKAAVFVRAVMQYVDRQDRPIDLPLRATQKAGMDAVEALGETISVPYVSKLTKGLETAEAITKTRKGKGFVVNKGSRFENFANYLEDNFEWGTQIEREDSAETISVRSQFLDGMKANRGIRISKDNPLPKAAYQVAIDKFKAGEYDMVFVPSTIDLNVVDYGDQVGWLHATRDASVANQK